MHGQGGAPLAGLSGIVHHDDAIVQTPQQLEVVTEVLVWGDDNECRVVWA